MSDMPNIDIRPDHWEIVRDILRKHVPQYEVWAFGSRAKWTAKPYSDLDLAVITDKPLPIRIGANLSEAFSESDLPWKVDVVDWATTGEVFRGVIEREKVVVQKGNELGVASNWREVSLGDVSDFITGYPFKSQYYTEKADDPRLIGGDNIAQGNLRWDNIRRWPLGMTSGLDDYWLKPGDVVLAMDRPWIEAGLKRAAVGKSDVPSLLVQRTARLRGTDELDTAFLRYLISGQAFTQYILSVQTGTAVPHISPTQIRAFRFRLPSVKEQQAIAHMLGSLDDKIELNRRSNETLEVMARTVFKAWFVDFEPVRAKIDGRWQSGQSLPGLPADLFDLFPSRFVESELGEIPEGWEMRSLDSIANYLNGLALQKFPPESEDQFLPVIKIAQLRAGNTNGADRASARIKPEYVVVDGDVLFSWSGSLEVDLWCGGLGALNQHLFKVTSSEYPKWLYYLWTRHHLNEFRRIAAGKATTMGHIQRGHLSSAKVVVPPKPLLESMSRIMAPLIDQLVVSRVQSRTLAGLRDSLLPKLLSGDLGVAAVGEDSEATA